MQRMLDVIVTELSQFSEFIEHIRAITVLDHMLLGMDEDGVYTGHEPMLCN